jgi:hypothetical protein
MLQTPRTSFAGGFMKQFNTLLAATLTSAAMLFAGAAVQAMEIQQFDKMAVQDKGDWTKPLRGIRVARPSHRQIERLSIR